MLRIQIRFMAVLVAVALLPNATPASGQASSGAELSSEKSSAAVPSVSGNALLRESIGLTGTVIFLDSGAPGMVLVVVRGPDVLVKGYGETAKGNGHEPDGRSLVRLGSLSKTFAGTLLASLAVDGKLRLTDPLRTYAGGASVPSFAGREITLLDLATHSAGLPREISDPPANAPPFTAPTRAQRWAWLSKYQIAWEPGTVAAYSSVSFDLLADALANAGSQPYPDLLRDRITGPLGMKDTGVIPSKVQCERLMLGSGIGGAGPCLPANATAGSGGIYSTGDDMAQWLKYNLALSDSDSWQTQALTHAIYRQRQTLTTAIGFDEAGPMSGLGLSWVQVSAHGDMPMVLEKSGGGGGFMTYMAVAPGRGVGVFVAVNRVDFQMFYSLTAAMNDLIANLATR